tara:strand:- start:1034 stop:1996 length:963 start_codon:yes stop_codon:yes gene_type:complete
MIDSPLFSHVTIIGLGLIGSSLARAIKSTNVASCVSVYDNDKEVRAICKGLKIADTVHDSISDAVSGADLVILAIPIRAYSSVAKEISQHLSSDVIITDVGSVKEEVILSLRAELPPSVNLVPGHPVAGTEHSGPESGFSELFFDRWVILTPENNTNTDAINIVKKMWEKLGSNVEIMDAPHHDRVLAITSHLPHLIAYTIVATAADMENQLQAENKNKEVVTTADVVKFSAGGFRDFTRIAGSNPVMWRDVFLSNKDAVLEMLGRFNEDLTALQKAIRWSDGEELEKWFTRTRDIRRGVIEAGQAGRFEYTENKKEDDN